MKLSLRPTGELVEPGEAKRRRELDLARRAGLRELKREEIGRIRYGRCEHEGVAYRILRGEVDPMDGRAVGFFRDPDCTLVYLEKAP